MLRLRLFLVCVWFPKVKFNMLPCFFNINNKSIRCFHDVSQVASNIFKSSNTGAKQSNFAGQKRGVSKKEDTPNKKTQKNVHPLVRGGV